MFCPTCHRELAQRDFYVCRQRRPNGLSYRCKQCTREYIKENRAQTNMARKTRRHRLGISKRYLEEIKTSKISEENNGQTRYYSSSRYRSRGKLYVEDWIIIRMQIYKRDNYTCQECLEKCHNTNKRKIQCHHIDYDINNNTLDNLITLCASCHAKTNFHRDDWKNYFINKYKDLNKKWL